MVDGEVCIGFFVICDIKEVYFVLFFVGVWWNLSLWWLKIRFVLVVFNKFGVFID